MNFLLRYYSLKGTKLFIIITICNLAIIWLSQHLLINETVFYNTYSEQLTYERSMKLFENMREFEWVSYALYPIILIIKSTFISIVIFTGFFFYNLNNKISFGLVFKVVLGSEVVFLIASLSKLLWLYFFGGNYDLNDIGFFYPLSVINIFNINEVARVWIYPLQILNFFQILYIISLSYGLRNLCLLPEGVADKVVLTSYLPAMGVWIAFILFISFDISL
ncbi:MAG TPA: hypothetical protein VMV47_17740 [Bacteroidales bacterium]|nr:hypothetical protein [Bacteroidales bacterium]